MAARQSDWISLTRQQATALIETVDQLNALRAEWTGLDYGNTLTEEDFAGANSDVTQEEIAAVIGVTLDAINALWAQGHLTNLLQVRL
jgi:hypothetical protein